MDRWKAGQWTARVCVILLIVTACICFVGWSFAVPDCGHDPGHCYKIDMGSVADWANAIFTLLAFGAAAWAAIFAYQSNMASRSQNQLSLLIQVTNPIFERANSLMSKSKDTSSVDDQLSQYWAFARCLHNLTLLRKRLPAVDDDAVGAICLAAMNIDFVNEMECLSKLSLLMKKLVLQELKFSGEVASNSALVENYNLDKCASDIIEDIRNFKVCYKLMPSEDVFNSYVKSVFRGMRLVSRQNP